MSCKLPVFCDQLDVTIPFYSVVGPPLRRNYRSLTNICAFPLLNICSIYPGLLGILGVCLSLFDIIRIINCGSVLPHSLWRTRLKSGKIVSMECERDLKLMSLVLALEYYLLLIIGTLLRNPILFMPWLVLHTFIITTEFLLFLLRLFSGGFTGSKQGLLMSMFMVYNWLCIFCGFFQLANDCDYC